MTTADIIRQAGRSLFGDTFQSDLARLLDVNNRTVRRWCAGEWEPLPFVWLKLREALDVRMEEIKQARKDLP